MSRSSSTCPFGIRKCPAFSNIQPTEPVSPRFPPYFENRCRTSLTVRFRLSVAAWTKTATPPGPYPS